MKRRKWMTLIAVLLIALMVFSITGCKSEDTANDVTPKDGKSANEEGVDFDPLGKYDPEITVSFVLEAGDSIYDMLNSLGDQTIDDNVWTRTIKEELGINIEYLWVAKSSEQYQQKLNIAMASGDIPDILKISQKDVFRLNESDMLQDLSGTLKYTLPLTQQIFDDGGEVPFKSVTVDGKLLGIPHIDSILEYSHFIWLRTDWLENLNLDPPETMDDLIDIIKAFKDDDPDGNGVDDTMGLPLRKDFLVKNGNPTITGFFDGFHAYPSIWIEKDGKLEFGGIQPEVKQALTVVSELYADGYIDQEFAVKDSGKANENLDSGKAGVFFGMHWNGFTGTSAKQNNPDAEYRPFPLVSADNDVVNAEAFNATTSWYTAHNDMENPEAIMKIMNLYFQKNYDEELHDFTGLAQTQTDDGIMATWQLCPVLGYTATLNVDIWNPIQEPLATGDTSSLWGEPLGIYNYINDYRNDGDVNLYAWTLIYDETGSWSIITNDYYPNDKYTVDAYYGPTTTSMIEKKSTLDSMQLETYTNIIMGQTPIDEFDKFVSDWKALGGEDITQEVNDWYLTQ